MTDVEPISGWSVSHLVGPEVALGSEWLRQRCAWCGSLLVDKAIDGEVGDDDIWPVGTTLRHEGSHWYVIPFDEATDLLPEDSCLELPLELTGTPGPGPGLSRHPSN